jgi:hypothetical protein
MTNSTSQPAQLVHTACTAADSQCYATQCMQVTYAIIPHGGQQGMNPDCKATERDSDTFIVVSPPPPPTWLPTGCSPNNSRGLAGAHAHHASGSAAVTCNSTCLLTLTVDGRRALPASFLRVTYAPNMNPDVGYLSLTDGLIATKRACEPCSTPVAQATLPKISFK